MGLYPPYQYSDNLPSYVKQKHLPLLAVRESQIPDLSYVQIPLINFLSDNSIPAMDSCPYADAQYTDYWHNKPQIFDDVSLQIIPLAR